jgi:hypothetical protein
MIEADKPIIDPLRAAARSGLRGPARSEVEALWAHVERYHGRDTYPAEPPTNLIDFLLGWCNDLKANPFKVKALLDKRVGEAFPEHKIRSLAASAKPLAGRRSRNGERLKWVRSMGEAAKRVQRDCLDAALPGCDVATLFETMHHKWNLCGPRSGEFLDLRRRLGPRCLSSADEFELWFGADGVPPPNVADREDFTRSRWLMPHDGAVCRWLDFWQRFNEVHAFVSRTLPMRALNGGHMLVWDKEDPETWQTIRPEDWQDGNLELCGRVRVLFIKDAPPSLRSANGPTAAVGDNEKAARGHLRALIEECSREAQRPRKKDVVDGLRKDWGVSQNKAEKIWAEEVPEDWRKPGRPSNSTAKAAAE